MTNRRFAFAAAVRVVARGHDRTADGRADPHVAFAAGLADGDVGVVNIADLADAGDAVEADLPCGVWGNAPTVPRPTKPKEVTNKGAGSEASLPVTLRVRRRAPKLLFPQDSVKTT